MKRATFRRWSFVHTWTSLVSTLFLLAICVTGLPLLFKDEIVDWFDDGKPYVSLPDTAPNASLDRIIDKSRALFPGEAVSSIFVDDDEPKTVVTMVPSWQAYRQNPGIRHWIKFDSRTAEVLNQSKPLGADAVSVLTVVLNLHKEMFAGLPGEIFVGLMGLLLATALVSGAVIYGPFMRKLAFGTVREQRSRRIKWLDLHNLLGIATVGWLLVVSATGFVNALSTPLFALWQRTDVATLLASVKDAAVDENQLSSAEAAFDRAKAALPAMRAVSVVFPGSPFGSPVHYVVWLKGKEPLTSRLFNPVLVDARNGKVDTVVAMPWYLRALEVARPLHFGDYGGTPLKIIWAIFDLAAIIVLVSGLYLWVARRCAGIREADAVLIESHALTQ